MTFFLIIIYRRFSCVHVTVHVTIYWNVLDHTVTVIVTVTINKNLYMAIVDDVDKSVDKIGQFQKYFAFYIDNGGGSVTIRPCSNSALFKRKISRLCGCAN